MNLLKREDGNVVIIVAISMMVLIAFAALGVDSGYLFYRHTQLQDYADTFALAAGRDYDGANLSTAIAAVKKSAENNGLTWTTEAGHAGRITNGNGESGVVDVISPVNGSIKVELKVDYNLSFSKAAFNKSSAPVAASAVAAKTLVGGYSKGLFPVGIVEKSTFVKDQDYTLTFDPGHSDVGGNYGFVNLDSYLDPGVAGNNTAGDSTFDTYLAQGYTGATVFYVGGTLNSITGEKTGQVMQNLGGIFPNRPDTWRTVMVPIIDHYGNDRIKILAFARFQIRDYRNLTGQEKQALDITGNDKKIVGRFVDATIVSPGNSNITTNGISNYAAQTLHLVQ